MNTGLGYATIQEAIDANGTLSGHTIFVEAGTYYEHVVVNKAISLVGENRDGTIIDGSGIGNVVHTVANNTIISGFSIQNGGPTYFGVFFDRSYHNTLIANKIANNYGSIGLFYSSENTLSNNDVTNNYDGISLFNSFNNTISNNHITSNFNYGIHLTDSCNNTISNNNITSSRWYGIYLGYSFNNILFGNVIANNGEEGIRLEYSSNNVIFTNNVTYNKNGLGFLSSSSNIIFDNNIIANKAYGIDVYLSSTNLIYHNNFVNDANVRVYDAESVNIWDNGYLSGGNYWSDYTGADLKWGPDQDLPGSDGIGDSAYTIDANNRDRYPLMKPWAPSPSKGPGDVNGDGKVNIYDVVLASVAYGSRPGDSNWNPNADLASPYGTINILDLVTITSHYGKEYP
jgi:parallel beta-helix repeat protein